VTSTGEEDDMQFDRYTIALLIRADDGPELDDDQAARLQDAHMTHLADLHDDGALVAAGPLLGETLRGLSIFDADPERARELAEQDPAVQAGVYSLEVVAWMTPGGAMRFSPARFPRSMAEAGGSSAS
jgi:uncharacterized protein